MTQESPLAVRGILVSCGSAEELAEVGVAGGCPRAVDDEVVAVDVGGVVAGEEQRCGGDLLRLRGPARRGSVNDEPAIRPSPCGHHKASTAGADGR